MGQLPNPNPSCQGLIKDGPRRRKNLYLIKSAEAVGGRVPSGAKARILAGPERYG
jgi:hypothetical protein